MKISLIISCVVVSMHVNACDICGGVNPNASIGVLASSNFHMIGVRSTYRMYSSYYEGIHHSSEHIFAQDLNFRIQLHKRLQLLGSIPYQSAIQMRDLGKDEKSGLGDPSALLNGIIVHKKDTLGNNRHFLTIGAGIKLPFGKYPGNETMIRNLYPGTGSLDLIFISNYTRQFNQKIGWQSELSYSIKGRNPHGFRFGNSMQLNSQFVYSKPWRGKKLIGTIGLNFDQFGKADSRGEALEMMQNGFVLSAKTSLNLLAKRWLYSVNVQPVVLQNLNQGNTKQRVVASLSINYLLQRSKK
jgi:hypothetical protein